MLQTGKYFGTITGSGTTTKGKNETPFLYVTLIVSHILDNVGNWVEIDQVNRDVEICINEKAWDFALEKLEKIGFNGDFECPLFAEKYYVEGVTLTCDHEEYEGKTYERWNFEDLAYTREYKALDAKSLQTLAARYKAGTRKAAPAAAPGAKKQLPPSAGTSGTQPAPAGQKQTAAAVHQAPADADIPF